MTDSVRREERLRDCPGFLRSWTAATVSVFGTYVAMLGILMVAAGLSVTPYRDARLDEAPSPTLAT